VEAEQIAARTYGMPSTACADTDSRRSGKTLLYMSDGTQVNRGRQGVSKFTQLLLEFSYNLSSF
jgi:hypothetical protein